MVDAFSWLVRLPGQQPGWFDGCCCGRTIDRRSFFWLTYVASINVSSANGYCRAIELPRPLLGLFLHFLEVCR